MIEIPEANVLAAQINNTMCGKRIKKVTAGKSPHKFAFFHGDPQSYGELLEGRTIEGAAANGGQLEIIAEEKRLVLGDGVAAQYHEAGVKLPVKHQLLLEFEDGSALSGSVQMYGFIWCFMEGELKDRYYLVAREKPSPLSEAFDPEYYMRIISAPGTEKLSAKALLATEQRIPGLGNGVLQDILFNAGIHPKRKVNTFSESDKERLYAAIKATLAGMVSKGGRNTEKDLFGRPGGYQTILSKNTVNKPCKLCNTVIKKEAYLGGSIYYCEGCQH